VVEPTLDVQMDAFLDVIGDLMRYRRQAVSTLPDDIVWRKERLEKLSQSDESKRIGDKDLFYRVGLIFARRSEPITMGDLSKSLDVPLSTATRIVDKLVEHGFAQRIADVEDRRVVRISWTDEGREMFESVCAFWRGRIAQLTAPLTTEERSELIRLLRKAVGALDTPLD
jgi:DNA-binding MarR family transcriptional regulator